MPKYTIKLQLNKHKANRYGSMPIYIKITINRKTSYLSTGLYIPPKVWDDKNERVKESYPMAELYNTDITHRKMEVIKKMVDSQVNGNGVTAATLKGDINEKSTKHNIFDFIEKFISEVKNKREASTLENYRKHAKRLEQFHKSKSLCFEDITEAYLAKYESHLREAEKGSVGANYTHALFKTMRTFFNAAIKKKLITNYPFTNYENPVYTAPRKDYLTLNELKKWEEFADMTTNQVYKQTAVYFLLGCYSGLRISDWFTFDPAKHIEDNRFKVRAKKNKEWVTMPISIPLQRTIERIKQVKLEIEEPTINEKLKIIAKKNGIQKHITSHTGRHTFAITMCAEQGISLETCAELMGITVNTCLNNYYRVTNRKIDAETNKAWAGLE